VSVAPFFWALVAIYALAGAACLAAALHRGRAGLADVLLLLAVWPLYAPFVLLAPPDHTSSREEALLRALRQVSGTPLARLLPDRAAVRALGRSLRAAARRLAEIEALLGRPEMAEEAALADLRGAEEPAGSIEARATLGLRVQNIRHLKHLRERFARRLCEVDALLAQLLTQVEVLRLGGPADAPGEALVGELLSRVEALGEMLEDGRGGGAAAAVP
jgi:hypothetical protein